MVNIRVRYLIRKATGVYYYQRRIPEELRQHFSHRTFIRKSLHTSDLSLAAKDDTLFASLRGLDPSKHKEF